MAATCIAYTLWANAKNLFAQLNHITVFVVAVVVLIVVAAALKNEKNEHNQITKNGISTIICRYNLLRILNKCASERRKKPFTTIQSISSKLYTGAHDT